MITTAFLYSCIHTHDKLSHLLFNSTHPIHDPLWREDVLRDTSAPVQQVHIAAPLALRVGGADARAGLRLSRQRLPGSSTTSARPQKFRQGAPHQRQKAHASNGPSYSYTYPYFRHYLSVTPSLGHSGSRRSRYRVFL